MNRKHLLIIILVIAVCSGMFYLRVKDNEESSNSTFLSKEEILDADAIITQTDEGFEPSEITIKKGTRVVWVNDASTFNWPASNLHPTHEVYPEFDPLEPIPSGKAWAFTFTKIGNWEFHDHLKPNRRGMVKVIETDAINFSRQELLEERLSWEERIEKDGGKIAYSDFVSKYKFLPAGDSHVLMHLFGEALYNVMGDKGIEVCDSSFIFGCYHGFMAKPVSEEGLGAITFFGQECYRIFKDNDPGCKHGLGHLLLEYLGDSALVEALEICKTFPIYRPLGGCAGGVFMEYQFKDFHRISSAGVMAKPFDPSDPYEPCSSLPEEFQPACYYGEPNWWHTVLNGDFEQIDELCRVLDKEALVGPCFQGVGAVAARVANFDPSETIRICNDLSLPFSQGNCLVGASWSFNSDSKTKGLAGTLCKALDPAFKNKCA